MSEKEISLGRIFVQEAVKAGTWGFILLLFLSIFLTSIRQDMKKTIAFGIDRFVGQVFYYTTHPYMEEKARALAKKGIDYTLKRAADETRTLFHVPAPDLQTRTPGEPLRLKKGATKGK
jgi:hypothetical protein